MRERRASMVRVLRQHLRYRTNRSRNQVGRLSYMTTHRVSSGAGVKINEMKFRRTFVHSMNCPNSFVADPIPMTATRSEAWYHGEIIIDEPRTPSANGSRVPPEPILTYCLDNFFQFGFLFCFFPSAGVGPGYFDFFPGAFSSASGTKSRELEKSGFKRVRRDIEVGPEGLLIANMPDKGSASTVVLGISGGRVSSCANVWAGWATFGFN